METRDEMRDGETSPSSERAAASVLHRWIRIRQFARNAREGHSRHTQRLKDTGFSPASSWAVCGGIVAFPPNYV
ncbi:hypothetical protein F2P81_020289 [Scophthalmus maximus]|uniref:Uncharacterized protein n=1 Tax=Scophthalmus maximus TaxID=52904 RepID=A0A6A4S5R5_SCOMX|nr:hypothetical protein F2P81_020289 [Scophthalmus maximus]